MANGAKMMLKLGIDVSDLSRELGKVEKTMVRFGNNMKNVGTTLSTSITAPILGVGAASLKAFADMQRLELGLTAIMGSSEAAAKELQNLRKTAENPGLALPQVVQASSTLQAVGMSADEARNTIVQFGNATARAGKDAVVFDELVFAFTKINSTGQITQEVLNQLTERLPELSGLLQKTFGATTAEGINATNITATEFSSKLVEALGTLERAQGGLGNTFDNLKDNVTASLAELGKTINESLKLEIVFAKLSEKIQMLVDKFKALTPEQQGNIVKFGLIAAAIGPLLIILGQLATSISAIITVTRTLIGTLSVLTGGTYLLVAAIGALVAHYATTDEGQKSLSKTGQLLSDTFDRLKAAFQTTLNLLSKLQPLFDVLLFVLAKITVLTFEVVIAQINAVLMLINFLYDGVVKVLEGLKLIDKQKVQPKINTGFGGGSAGKPSGAGASWTEDVPKPPKKESPILPPKITIPTISQNKPINIPSESLSRGPAMSPVDTLPTLNLLPDKITSVAAANEKLKKTNEDVANSFKKITPEVKSLEDLLSPMQKSLVMGVEAFANLAESGFKSMKDLADAVRKSIAVIVGDMIKVFVSKALAGLPPSPFMLAIAPAIAALAGSLGKNLIMKIGAPKLAQGGLAFSPTMAMVGDNRNARVDPEVIAPLSKLKAMIGDGMGGGTLETRISGNDLIILLNRSQKNLNRVQ
jgi:tape measure domain-containing protein